ncbi:MAG: hypothetical protein ABI415_00420 [Flavitalea sp.]
MKALKTFVFLSACLCVTSLLDAQKKNSIATIHAIKFADSLNQAFKKNDWNDYLSISYPGVIKYYGGTRDFKEYIARTRNINSSIANESPEKVQVVQMVNQINEWQCVVEKTRSTMIDGKKAQIVSYMVGQSMDEGNTWKYFDVAYSSPENLVYIMPDIFHNISVPQRKIIFEKDQLVSK